MTRHFVKRTSSCPNCGGVVEIRFSVAARGHELRVARSLRCPTCGNAEEEDGVALSDEARDAFRKKEGIWSLRMASVGPRRAEVLRVLRDALRLTLIEANRLMGPGALLVEGIVVEVERVEILLTSVGAETVRVRLP
jgi:hypothetical protein